MVEPEQINGGALFTIIRLGGRVSIEIILTFGYLLMMLTGFLPTLFWKDPCDKRGRLTYIASVLKALIWETR